MKHVLLIAGSFTSANFNVMSDVIRAKYGKDLMIHAISANNDPQKLLAQYDDVKYYPVYNYKLFLSKKNREQQTFWTHLLFSLICIYTNVAENFYPMAYERKIYRIGKSILQKENIDTLFSVCMPFYAHRVAYKLIKKRNIRWYSFWVDPYLNKGVKISGLQRWCHRYAERRNLQHSSIVYALPEVFDNHELQKEFKDKIQTFEIPYITEREVSIKNRDIVFAGLFYKGVREPEPMFDIVLMALPQLPKEIVFKFYVRNPDCYSEITAKSQSRMQFYGFVNRNELNSILSECYMLVNVGNMNPVQMPSKVVEYISFRKPILFFYCNKEDRSFRFFKDYPDVLPIFVNGDKKESAKKLVAFLNEQHFVVSYDKLLENSLYCKSTPQYIKTILK